MQLQPAPLYYDWLFHWPVPLLVVLLGVAAVCRVLASRRRDERLNYAALAALALAGALFLAAHFVETPYEKVEARTRELVAATAPLNMQSVDAVLSTGCILTGPGGEHWLRFDEVRAELQRALERYAVESHGVRGVGVEVTSDTEALSLLQLATTMRESLYGAPMRTQWLLHWQNVDGQWRVTQIQWLEINGQPPHDRIWR